MDSINAFTVAGYICFVSVCMLLSAVSFSFIMVLAALYELAFQMNEWEMKWLTDHNTDDWTKSAAH